MSIVKYGTHSRQVFLHYERKLSPAIVFIHGGAWRDPNNTCHDFKQWAHQLVDYNVFSIDYRLAPEYQHPSQLNDVLHALEMILELVNGSVTLCGHSVGATLMSQIVETKRLNSRIKTLIFMDGIYSIKDLLQRYPSYEGFILEEYKDAEAATKSTFIDVGLKSEIYKPFKIKIVYSENDELLDWKTTQVFTEWLQEDGVDFEIFKGPFGKHNDVYESPLVLSTIFN